jgi:hypothetical protein
MMFVGYVEQESDSICMCDKYTTRIIVTHDIIYYVVNEIEVK